jgi:hypothetical protein
VYEKSLADGHVKSVNDPHQKRDRDQFPFVDQIRQRQSRQHERQNHRNGLRRNHPAQPVVVIAHVTTQRGEKQDRHLARESKHAEQCRRMRQLVNQPKLRHVLHPCPDQRYKLARNKELKVAVLQGAEARRHGWADRCAAIRQNISSTCWMSRIRTSHLAVNQQMLST